jgi:hypothetical protein
MKATTKLLCLIAGIILFISCNSYGDKEVFNGTEVYYKTGVNKDEAVKLGNYLVSSEFADGNSKSVQLVKNEETGAYVFRMVTNKEARENDSYDFIFKLMAIQISDSVFNKQPVDFDVCDDRFKTVKTFKFSDGL